MRSMINLALISLLEKDDVLRLYYTSQESPFGLYYTTQKSQLQ